MIETACKRARTTGRGCREADDGTAFVAMTFKSAVDDPSRITKSKTAGAQFGLKHQSKEKDRHCGITRAGDEMVRTALYEAANLLQCP